MSKTIKTLSFFLTMILLVNVFSLNVFGKQNAVNFKVNDVVAEKDAETAQVIISVDKHQGIAAADIKIKCDLEIIAIECDKFDVFSNNKTGRVNWSYAKNRNDYGDLIYVTFAVPKISESKLWVVDLEIVEVIDENIEDVPCTVQSGSVSVKVETNLETENNPDSQNWFLILWNKIVSFLKSVYLFLCSIFTK